MTLYTNVHNVPVEYVNAVQRSHRPRTDDPRTISVTSLIAPPQQRRLLWLHDGDLRRDVLEDFRALFGTAVHQILEAGAREGARPEVQMHRTVDWTGMCEKCGDDPVYWTITGKPDHYHDGLLTDWKTTGANKQYETVKLEWEQQLNAYTWLMREVGCAACEPMPVEALRVVEIFYDWKPHMTQPPRPLIELPVQLWEPAAVDEFVFDRIAAHERALHQLEPCTDEERWQGRRCEAYCGAALWCDQWRTIQQGEISDGNSKPRRKRKEKAGEQEVNDALEAIEQAGHTLTLIKEAARNNGITLRR